MTADKVPFGTRYKNGQLVVKEEAVDGDLLIAIDKRTMKVIGEIGDSIHPSM